MGFSYDQNDHFRFGLYSTNITRFENYNNFRLYKLRKISEEEVVLDLLLEMDIETATDLVPVLPLALDPPPDSRIATRFRLDHELDRDRDVPAHTHDLHALLTTDGPAELGHEAGMWR